VAAAQQILAENTRVEVSVQQITEAAGVGLGSFYYHFTTKDELFEAAVLATLDQHAAAVESLTSALEDPAEKFAVGVRLTGRLGRAFPQLARVLIHSGVAYVRPEYGLAALALRDVSEGREAGRFDVDDPELVLSAIGGAVLGLLQHLDTHPDADAGRAADDLAVLLLRMLGLTTRQARSVVARPLPPAEG